MKRKERNKITQARAKSYKVLYNLRVFFVWVGFFEGWGWSGAFVFIFILSGKKI